MASRALPVAVAAGALLVVVIVADASMNRTYHLEAQVEGRWVGIATLPQRFDRYAAPSLVPFELNASDALPMRLRLDNGYPWPASKAYEVTVQGRALHDDVVAAPALGEGISQFELTGESLFRTAYGDPRAPAPAGPREHVVYFTLAVGGEMAGGEMAFREVSR